MAYSSAANCEVQLYNNQNKYFYVNYHNIDEIHMDIYDLDSIHEYLKMDVVIRFVV